MNQRGLIEKNYLRIPIRKDAVEKNVWLYQELTAVLQFQAGLFVDYGSGAPDFYAELPVERWKGSVLTLVHETGRFRFCSRMSSCQIQSHFSHGFILHRKADG